MTRRKLRRGIRLRRDPTHDGFVHLFFDFDEDIIEIEEKIGEDILAGGPPAKTQAAAMAA